MKIDDNPFERWDLNPADDDRTLTEKMRSRSRQLEGVEHQRLQESWRELMSDPVARARWTLLTPPAVGDERNPWEFAERVIKPSRPARDLPELTPTLDDAIALPLMDDEQLYASPPFLPALLQATGRPTAAEEEGE